MWNTRAHVIPVIVEALGSAQESPEIPWWTVRQHKCMTSADNHTPWERPTFLEMSLLLDNKSLETPSIKLTARAEKKKRDNNTITTTNICLVIIMWIKRKMNENEVNERERERCLTGCSRAAEGRPPSRQDELTRWGVSLALTEHLVSIISPFHRPAPPIRPAWEPAQTLSSSHH